MMQHLFRERNKLKTLLSLWFCWWTGTAHLKTHITWKWNQNPKAANTEKQATSCNKSVYMY